MTRGEVRLPVAFRELFDPHRYKAYWGGRGSGKSHSFATALVVQAATQPLLILCCREIQKSLKESVKLLVEQKIQEAGAAYLFESVKEEIRGANGSRFIFAGLRTNPDTIKSTEGIDRAWVEEASRVSQRSLEILEPTIRRPGSELWFSWNPDQPTDPVDALFRGPRGPPPGAIVREVHHDANPFFVGTPLATKLEWDRRRDPDRYAHVWRGAYRKSSEARVFRNWRVEEFDTPADARFFHGADWGFASDPSVLVRCFRVGRTVYVDREAYAVGCEIDHLPALFAGTDPRDPPRWENPKRYPGVPTALRWPIRADSSRPDTISHLRRRGFTVVPARKGAGSVEEGVEFLKSLDLVVHPRCTNVVDELTFYSWKTDPRTGEVLPVLEDKHNHLIDSLRYALEEERRGARTSGARPGGATQVSSFDLGD